MFQEELPADIRTLLANGEEVTIGRSEMQVWHVAQGYLKLHYRDPVATNALAAERDRLDWLQGRLPVPQIYAYGSELTYEYLYTSEIEGVMACDRCFREDMPLLIALIAEALHMVHAIPQLQCPFSLPLDERLAEVHQRIAGEQIDEELFLRDRDMTPQTYYQHIERIRPASDDLVFTHGDFCLPNILIDPQKRQVAGIIDWSRGGIADRHEDINSACWSLGYNFDRAWIPLLKQAYGETLIDENILAFYELFDDLSSYMK